MKTENVVKVLEWLKENNAHMEHGVIDIPKSLQKIILEIVGENKGFTEEVRTKKIPKDFLYQRILINKEFAYTLPESYWWEQYQFVQNKVIYFNNIKHRSIDKMVPLSEQMMEKKEAEFHLEYLNKLSDHLQNQMKNSENWMNQLTYLLG